MSATPGDQSSSDLTSSPPSSSSHPSSSSNIPPTSNNGSALSHGTNTPPSSGSSSSSSPAPGTFDPAADVSSNPSNTGPSSTTGASKGGNQAMTGNVGSTGSTNGGSATTDNGTSRGNSIPLSGTDSSNSSHSSSSTMATSTLPSSSTKATPTSSSQTSTVLPSSTVTPSSMPPTPTSSAPSSAVPTSTSVPPIVSTSTNPANSVVYTTVPATPSSAPGINPPASTSDKSSSDLIGPIIGGVAGGLVGIILLTWLILIPIRKRAERRKEVDWMPFGSENGHLNNDSGNDSLYRTPRAGVGEAEAKAMDSPEIYQMSDIGSNTNHNENLGSLYSHLDHNKHQQGWTGAGEGYNIASEVVGDVPPGQCPPTYAAYYQHGMQPQQHHGYTSYAVGSPNGSPEMAAQRYVGQEGAWAQQPTSSQGHHAAAAASLHSQHSLSGYPSGAMAMGRYPAGQEGRMLSRNASNSTTTAYDPNYGTHVPPPVPPHSMAHVASSRIAPVMQDQDDDCTLAYTREDSAGPDRGLMSGLHVVNPGR